MITSIITRCGILLPKQNTSTRSLFHWLNIIFNQIDQKRLQEFGPDRTCAEWLLRNGAAVQWVGKSTYFSSYNLLPKEGSTMLYIEKIDASGSSISHYGFMHLQNCEHIREIILHDCGYIENDALKQLAFVQNSLEHLQVSSCGNITDKGIIHLKDLNKLKTLKLFKLPAVKDKQHVIQILKDHLQNCKIESDFEKPKSPTDES